MDNIAWTEPHAFCQSFRLIIFSATLDEVPSDNYNPISAIYSGLIASPLPVKVLNF